MSNVKVAIRVRPLNKKEKYKNAEAIVDVHGDSVAITNPKVEGIAEFGDSREKVKHFTFDYCYDSTLSVMSPGFASQELVFQDLGTEVLQAAFEGYNACVFAYGQTSTGKTYTMMGYPGEVGLIPRICEGLFSHVDDNVDQTASFRVDISYLEIYNERVRDLLHPADVKQNDKYTLKVREHPKDGPYVQDLSQHLVKDNNEIQMLLERGNDARTTAATYMHDHSSRSHAIVTVSFTQAKLEDDMPSEKVSRIHMVDLAGSERADPNFSPEYKGRLKEGANINKSLVTLGNVIKALAEKSILSWSSDNFGSVQNLTGDATSSSQGTSLRSSSFYVPYRDSVLTWLLKDSLGGNSKTLMIATVTSASVYYRESLSTLRYAQRAKSIVNQPKVNEDANVTLIRELRREIEQLTGMLLSAQRQNEQLNEITYFVPTQRKGHDVDSQVGNFISVQDTGTSIEEKLHENEAKANQLTRSWMEKWTETHEIMKDSDLCIRGLGNRTSSMGVLIDSQLPHLIGMDDDILSTGVKMYHLKEGKTLVGTEAASRQQDIVLSGPLILKEHCFIKNHMGTVTLYPNRGAKCSLNGINIKEPKKLCQGDYILLGKVNMFRFNNPSEAAKLREHRNSVSSLPLQTCQSVGGDQSCYSSSSSLADESGASCAGLLPHFRIFNANYASSDLCLELEKTCKTEQEKIEQARKVLRSLSREHRLVEHLRVEREEKMWQQREQGSTEVDLEQQKLVQLIETTQDWKATQDDKIRETKRNLLERWVSYQKQLNGEIEKLRNQQHYMDQVKCPLSGVDGEQICQYMMCVEGRYKALALQELINIVNHNNMEMEVMKQEKQVEDHYQLTRDKIKTQMKLIEQIKEQFDEADASRLDEVNAKVQELEDLQMKEEQLQLFIEEKQILIQVGSDKPKPLRSACSELVLTDLQDVRIPFKPLENSISSQHHGSEGNLPSVSKRLLRTTAADNGSTMSISSSMCSVDSLEQEKESDITLNLNLSNKSGKKLSTTAQNVTDRLYQPAKAKFKYKPSSKKNKKNDPRGRSPEKVSSDVVRSRSLETDDDTDVFAKNNITSSPDYSGVMRGQMLSQSASSKLLHMSTASLASVPEVASESNEETESSDHKNTFQVVLRRNKRHNFSDDDFRRHSEPVGETLASAFEQYSKEMEESESIDRSSLMLKRSRKRSPMLRGYSDEIDEFRLLSDVLVTSGTSATEDSNISSTSLDKTPDIVDSSGGTLVSSMGSSAITLTGFINENGTESDTVDLTESENMDEPVVKSESKGDNEQICRGDSLPGDIYQATLCEFSATTLTGCINENGTKGDTVDQTKPESMEEPAIGSESKGANEQIYGGDSLSGEIYEVKLRNEFSATPLTGSINENCTKGDTVDLITEPVVRSESEGDAFTGAIHQAKLKNEITLKHGGDLEPHVITMSQINTTIDSQRGHETSTKESSGNSSPSIDSMKNSGLNETEDLLLNTHSDVELGKTKNDLGKPQLFDAGAEQIICTPFDLKFTDRFESTFCKEIPMAFQLLTSTFQQSVTESLSTEHERVCEHCCDSVDTDSLAGSEFACDHHAIQELTTSQSINSECLIISDNMIRSEDESVIISDNMIGPEHEKFDTCKDSQSNLAMDMFQNIECTDFFYCSNSAQLAMPLEAVSGNLEVPGNLVVQPSDSPSLIFYSPESDEDMLVIDYSPKLDVTAGSPTAETSSTQHVGGDRNLFSDFSEDSLDYHEQGTECDKLPESVEKYDKLPDNEEFVKKSCSSFDISPSESCQDNLENMYVGELSDMMKESSVQDLCVCVQMFPKVIELEVPSILAAAEKPVFQQSSEKTLHGHNARRLARHKAMQRQRSERDSEITSQFSDDSLASDGKTKPSSRPGSGSRRRRKPHSKGSEVSAKHLKSHSSEEYAPSGSDDIYSDDSLTQFQDFIDKKVTPQLSEGFQKFTDCISDLSGVHENDVCTIVSVETSKVKMADTANGDTDKLNETESQIISVRTDDSSDIHTQIMRQLSGSTQTELSTSVDSTQTDTTYMNLVVSPLSVWSSADSNVHSTAPEFCQNVAGGVICAPDRSGCRRKLSPCHLSNGPTDVWANEQCDSNVLTCLSMVNEEDSFVMETEVLSPTSAIPCDYLRIERNLSRLSASGENSEFYQNGNGFCQEEERRLSADRPMLQSNSKIIVDDLKQTDVKINENNENTPIKFEVTVQETETNILFNVEKTEYRTYSLRSTENSSNMTVPESIDINLTETRHIQHDDNYESTVREQVVFQLPESLEIENGNNSIVTNSFYQSTLNTEHDVDRENGQVSRESSVERQSNRESSDSYVQPTSSRQQNVNDSNTDAINFEESDIDSDAPAISEIGGLTIDINSDRVTHDPQELISAERMEQEFSFPSYEVTATSSPRVPVKCGMEYPLKNEACSNVESDCTSDYGTIASEGKQDKISGESDSSQDVESLRDVGKFQSSDHNDSLLFPESPRIESLEHVEEKQISPSVVKNIESEGQSSMPEFFFSSLDLQNNYATEDHDQLGLCASNLVENVDAAKSETETEMENCTAEGATIDSTDEQNTECSSEYEYIQMNGEIVPLNRRTYFLQSETTDLKSTTSSDSSREQWDQLRRGSEDCYMTPPELQRQSSESSDYRTPQTSPRLQNNDGTTESVSDQALSVDHVQIPDMPSDSIITNLNIVIDSRHSAENRIRCDDSEGSSSELIENVQTTKEMEHYNGLWKSPKPVYSESLPRGATGLVLNSGRTSLPLNRGNTATSFHRDARQLTSETDDSVFSESFGRDLDRRSIRFQRHIRSLSDSAISSDYTDAESATMSPGASKTCDSENTFVGSSLKHRIDVYGEHFATQALAFRVTEKPGKPQDILSNKTSDGTLIKDPPNRYGEVDVDLHSNETTMIEKSPSIDQNILPPPLLFSDNQNSDLAPSINFLQQSNSHMLSSTILDIRRSGLVRSISLDSLTISPSFRRLTVPYIQKYLYHSAAGDSEADELGPRSMTTADTEHQLLQIPVVSKSNIILEHTGGVNSQTIINQDSLVDSEGNQLLLESHQLSPGEVALESQSLEEMHNLMDGYDQLPTNDSYGQKFAIMPGMMEKYPSLSELENGPECIDVAKSKSEGSIDQQDNRRSNDSITFIFMPRTHGANNNIDECNQEVEEQSLETTEEKPLPHKYGINESYLPIYDHSVSSDNIPKEHLKQKYHSHSKSLLDVDTVDDNEAIFPPNFAEEFFADQNEVFRISSERYNLTSSNGKISPDLEMEFVPDDPMTIRNEAIWQGSDGALGPLTVSPELPEEYIGPADYLAPDDLKNQDILYYPVLNIDGNQYVAIRSSDNFPQNNSQREDTHTSRMFVSRGVQATLAETGTQTDGESITTDQSMMSRSLLPLFSPFRSHSTEDLHDRGHAPRLNFSDEADRWCDLSALMLETTHLIKNINIKLPGMAKMSGQNGTLNGENKVLYRWTDEAAQTGRSLPRLNTAGIQTETGSQDDISEQPVFSDDNLRNPERHDDLRIPERHAATTQTDERPLSQGEISIIDYLPETVERIARDIYIQRVASGVSVLETMEMSIESGTDYSWTDDSNVDSILQSSIGSGSDSVDLSSPQQHSSTPLKYKRETRYVLPTPKLEETTENSSSPISSFSTGQPDIETSETMQNLGEIPESSSDIQLKWPEHDTEFSTDFSDTQVLSKPNSYLEADVSNEESVGNAQLSDKSEDNIVITFRMEAQGNMHTQYGKHLADPGQVNPANDENTSKLMDQNTQVENKEKIHLSALEQSQNTESDVDSAELDNSFSSANTESDSTVISADHLDLSQGCSDVDGIHVQGDVIDDVFSDSCDESPKESLQTVPMLETMHVDNSANLDWSDRVSMSVNRIEFNLHGDKRSWTQELAVSESEVVSISGNGKPGLSKEQETPKLSISDREMFSIDEILVSNKNLTLSETQVQEFIFPLETKIDACDISETHLHDFLPENGPKKENITVAEIRVHDIVSEVPTSDTEGCVGGIETTGTSELVDVSKTSTDDVVSEVSQGQDLAVKPDNVKQSGVNTDTLETRESPEKCDAESESRLIENSSQLLEYLEDLGYVLIEAEECLTGPEENAESLKIQPVKVKPTVFRKAEVAENFGDQPENEVMKSGLNNYSDSKKATLSESEMEQHEFIDRSKEAIPASDTKKLILGEAEMEVHEYVDSGVTQANVLSNIEICEKETKKPSFTVAEVERHEFIDKSRNFITRIDMQSQTDNTLLEKSKMACLSEAEIEKHEYLDESVSEKNAAGNRLSEIKAKGTILKESETERHEFVDKEVLSMEENANKLRTDMSLLVEQKTMITEAVDTNIPTSPNNDVEQDISEFPEPGVVKERIIAFTEISKQSDNLVELNAQLRDMNNYHGHPPQTLINIDPQEENGYSDQTVSSLLTSGVANHRRIVYHHDPLSATNRKLPVCREVELQVQDYIPPVDIQNRVASLDISVGHESMLDDFTQTDGANINKLEYDNFDIRVLKEMVDRGEFTGSLKEELERLQKERLQIIELMSLNYLPASLTVELLEAKLNYCNGQTDLLLESLDDGLSDIQQSLPPHIQGDIIHDYLKHVDDEIIKSKQNFNQLKTKLVHSTSSKIQHMKMSQPGRGKGRAQTRFKDRDLLSLKRRAEIESFKIERLMEQQRHDRSRSESPMKEQITRSASPVSVRTSSPIQSVISPHQHKNHLIALRCQVIKTIKQEETTQLAHRHHSLPSHLKDSLSYSPHISVSVVDDDDSSHGMSVYTCKPRTSSPRSRIQPRSRVASLDRGRMSEWPGSTESQSATHRSLPVSRQSPRNYPQDTAVMAQSIYSEKESELLLDEIRQARQHNQREISEALDSLKNAKEQIEEYKSDLNVTSFSPEKRGSLFLQLRQAENCSQSVSHSSFCTYVENMLSETSVQGLLTGTYELYDEINYLDSHPFRSDVTQPMTEVATLEDHIEQRLLKSRPLTSNDIKTKLRLQRT